MPGKAAVTQTLRFRFLGPLLIAGAGLTLTTSSALAQAQCGKRDVVLTTLAEKFGETRRGMGIAANNGVMEVFASEVSGSWTITVTMPDGVTCLVASGQSYEAMQDALPARGKPA